MFYLPRVLLAILAAFLGPTSALADKPPQPGGGTAALPEGARFRFASLHLRQPSGIRNSALSPDGRFLATASGRRVMIWDLSTARTIRQFECPDSYSYSSPDLTFSPDGALLGHVHGRESAFVWNVKTGQEVLNLNGRIQTNGAGQFTPDGVHFVVVSQMGLHFWNLATRAEDRIDPTQKVNTLSPDTAIYVQVDEKAETILGDARTGKEIGTIAAAVANNGAEKRAGVQSGQQMAGSRPHQ